MPRFIPSALTSGQTVVEDCKHDEDDVNAAQRYQQVVEAVLH